MNPAAVRKLLRDVDRAMNGRKRKRPRKPPETVILNDPTGEIYGFPTFRWGEAPRDLFATRRQLSTLGLRKNRQDPVAQMLRNRRGRRNRTLGPLRAWLYLIPAAAPKFPMTEAKQRAVQIAADSRKWCGACETRLDFVPRWGVCEDCREKDPDRYPS